MARTRSRAAVLLIVLGLALCTAGCGGSEEAVSADTLPFEAAIAQYLADKHMGMKVAEFKRLEVRDETAEATCRMQEASAMHRISVTWRFSFERQRDGRWQVTEHQTR